VVGVVGVGVAGAVGPGVTAQVDADVAGESGVTAGRSGAPVVPEAMGFAACSSPDEIVTAVEDVEAVVPESAVVGVGSPVAPDVGGWHVADDAVPGVASPGPPLELGALVGLGWTAAVGPPSASGPVSSGVGVAAPSVSAPVRGRGGYGPPPWSTVVPAWMIA
jgi:hypothetical protein